MASSVLAASTKERPADAVLRAQLKEATHLTARERREVSEAVFTFFRWKGWLERRVPYMNRLERALELAERFRANPFTLTHDNLAAKAVPSWVGEQVTLRAEWLRHLQRPPRLWLRARPGQAKELAKRLGNARPAQAAALPDAVTYEGTDDLFLTPSFEAGEFEIQDISSQAVAVLCAPAPGETWWDACAGEGGKLLHLADLMQNRGLIWASDRAEWRLEKLAQRAARAKIFNYRSVIWDGGPKPPTRTLFDGVLVDAPCTGLGTWGRNPHARWTTTLKDVMELAELQKALLQHVAPQVKPGGKLVFAVCTLTRAETTEVADHFAAAHPEFEPWQLPHPFHAGLAASPRVLLWPQDTDGNGMYIAAWRRKPD